MFALRARARSFLVTLMIPTGVSLCLVGSATAQTRGDSVRARLRDSDVWTSGRFVRFDSLLLLEQSGQRLQLQRELLVQVQAYRRRSPLLFLALGTGVALAGYHVARLVAGSDSDWACDGCGITWHEGRDYLLFGAGGFALGAIAYFIWPPRWKTVFAP